MISKQRIRDDIRVESYSNDILTRYNVTDEAIGRSAVDSLWNDPLVNWCFPLAKDKDEYKYESTVAQFQLGIQKCYNQQSTNPEIVAKNPNVRSFLCFYNPTHASYRNNSTNNTNSTESKENCIVNNDNLNSNPTNDSINSNVNDGTNIADLDFKYAGTATVCAPDLNAINDSNSNGFIDIIDDSYIMDALKRALKTHFFKFIKCGYYAGWVELNKAMIFEIIKPKLKHCWFMEVVNINQQFQGKGIGSYLLQNILNNHIIPKSKEYNYNGFVILNTGNEKTQNFYQKNGYQLVTQFKLPPITNDKNEIIDNAKFILYLWHQDSNTCQNMIDQFGLEKEWKLKSVSQCLKWKLVPKSLQCIPIKWTMLVLIIVVIILVCLFEFVF